MGFLIRDRKSGKESGRINHPEIEEIRCIILRIGNESCGKNKLI